MSCGLKCSGTLEYVDEPVAAVVTGPRWEWCGQWQCASCVACSDTGFPRRCLVHRHRQLVACEWAAARRLPYLQESFGLYPHGRCPEHLLQVQVCWLEPVKNFSQYTGYVPDNVWSGPKQFVTHKCTSANHFRTLWTGP